MNAISSWPHLLPKLFNISIPNKQIRKWRMTIFLATIILIAIIAANIILLSWPIGKPDQPHWDSMLSRVHSQNMTLLKNVTSAFGTIRKIGVRDSGFGVRGSEFSRSEFGILTFGVRDSHVRDSGFGVRDSEFGIRDSHVRSSGFGIRGSGFGVRVFGYYDYFLHRLKSWK